MEEKQAKTPRIRSRRTVQDSVALSVTETPMPKRQRAPRKVSSSKKTLPTEVLEKETPAPKKRIRRAASNKKVEPIAHVMVQHEDVNEASVPIIRNQFQLALLSPFRFPIDHVALAAQVARIGGVAFVVVGALFTLINMQLWGSALMSEREASERQLASTLTTYDCTDTENPYYNETYCTNQAPGGTIQIESDPTPDVEVRIDSPTPYTNTVPIQIVVPYASQVVVSAYAKDEGRNILLGNAYKLDDLHWVYHWDTKKYADGRYRLKIVVTNVFGSYMHDDSTDRIIANYLTDGTASGTSGTSGSSGSGSVDTGAIATTSQTTATTSANTSPSTTLVTTAAPSISLSIDEDAPLEGDAQISVLVVNAGSVKLYARNVNSGSYAALGYAVYKGNNEWRYVWNTKQFPNAPYRVRALVSVGGVFYESDFIDTSIEKETQSVTASTTSVTNTATTTTAVMPGSTLPDPSKIFLSIAGSEPRRGDIDVFVGYPDARFVELYLLPQNALIPRFLGLAARKSTTEWRYRWDTRQTPNGQYAFYARVGTDYGAIESARTPVRVENVIEMAYSPAEETYLEDIEDVTALLEKSVEQPPLSEGGASTTVLELPPQNLIFVKPIDDVVAQVDVEDAVRPDIEQFLQEFKNELDAAIIDYARAVRASDATAIETIMQEIESLRARVLASLPISPERRDVLDLIDADLREMIAALTEMTKRNETIIKERIGDRVFADADKDGISDYDEINLYATDPFSADTDADGYTDGAEILGGFDPRDARGESLVVHESPKETGIVREDVLTVQSIATLPKREDEEDTDGVPVAAVITGTALPNSFVTLYIFSTPIVVTVKTDEEGAWSYLFDKELENGEHEVYVAFTDNAGRIVAKSNPLPFVKTAEAFTPIDANTGSVLAVTDAEPSLITDRMMLVIASLAIVALGLVLILLGLHITRRQEEQFAIQ